jgi:SSS family solute:Na+ symporter
MIQIIIGGSLAIGVASAAAAGIALLYRGGLFADVRMSVLSFFGMYLGFGVILAHCVVSFPLGPAWSAIPRRELLSWDGGQGLPMVLSFFILGAWTFVDPGFHQRVAGSADPAIGRKGVAVAVACWAVFDLLSIGTAMYAVADRFAHPDSLPAPGLAMLPEFGSRVLPEGLRALFLAGILGTITSAMVGYILVSGSTLGRDIAGRLAREASDNRIILWNRLGMVAACIVAVGLALWIKSVVSLWYSWSGAVVGAMLVPVSISYGLFPRSRCSGAWVFASIVASAAVSLALLAYGVQAGNPYLSVAWNGNRFALGTLIPALAVSAAIIGIGEILAIIRGNDHGREPSVA